MSAVPMFRPAPMVRPDLSVSAYGADDSKTNWLLLGAAVVGVGGMLLWWFSKPMKANRRRRRRS